MTSASAAFSELAPGVFSFSSRFVEAKYGIVIGARSALIIDVPYFEDELRAVADFVTAKQRAPNRIQLTHGHGDHVLGAAVFGGAEVFAHALTPGVIADHLSRWADGRKVPAAELFARALIPTVLASGEIVHDLGGVRARVLAAPGHSPDGQSVLIEEHGVLFAGDTATTGILPATEWGDSRVLETSQRMLARMEIDTLVPGHGEVIVGRAQAREWLIWMADYLAGTRDAVRDGLRRGESDDLICERASYARCVGDRFDPSRNNMVRRHATNARKILAEERGAP
ncbi:MAG: MBL fold metallo-hydrolase [Thermoflexales bacterium]